MWLLRSGFPLSRCGVGAGSWTPWAAAGPAWHKRGPKGPSLLSHDIAADIRARRSGGATLQAVADAVGVSVTTVRRALAAPTAAGLTQQEHDQRSASVVDLPVLPAPSGRDAERLWPGGGS